MYTMVGWIFVGLFARVPDAVIARYSLDHTVWNEATRHSLVRFDAMLRFLVVVKVVVLVIVNVIVLVVVLRRPGWLVLDFAQPVAPEIASDTVE